MINRTCFQTPLTTFGLHLHVPLPMARVLDTGHVRMPPACWRGQKMGMGSKGTPCPLQKGASDFNHRKWSIASVCLVSAWVPTQLIFGLLGMTPFPSRSLPPWTRSHGSRCGHLSSLKWRFLPVAPNTPACFPVAERTRNTVKRQTTNWKQFLQHVGLSDNVIITSTG